MAAFSNDQKTRCESSHVDPITRDFLGGSLGIEPIELDLDWHAPLGCEIFLDLESGKLYVQRVAPFLGEMQPSSSRAQPKPSSNLALDLGVAEPLNGTVAHENTTYRSVFTIDYVRWALERISPSLGSTSKKRSCPAGSSSTSYSTGSALDPFGNVNVAVCCPSCQMYVKVLKTDHKCPKCGAVVPMANKPRIDLDLSL